MSICGFHIKQLAYNALVCQSLCLDKAGGQTANLTYHKLFACFVLSLNHLLTVLNSERHGLFEQHMLACVKGLYRDVLVRLVACCNNDCIYVAVCQHFVSAVIQRHFQFKVLCSFLQVLAVCVAKCYNLCSFLIFEAFKMYF